MTRISSDGIHALAALMRAQVQALGRPLSTAPTGVVVRREDKPTKRAKSEDLAVRLARRVRAIDLSDPDAEGRALHVFLESVLLAEFGEHLINDVAFHQSVEEVLHQMRGNAQLAELMSAAARTLLRERDDP